MLQTFLDNKPLYYDKIDYTRMPKIYERIKKFIKIPKIIHLVGTNGKGTTGRFLASALFSMGFCTGHYTSPHILEFNERIWLDGKNVSDEILNKTHIKLLSLLTPEEAEGLSYFEYTTFLAIFLYQECDYIVLEAGLGGEYDATAVFENILTLITPIDFDHEAFLGSDIKSIAKTKLNAIQKRAVLGKQTHSEVLDMAQKIAQIKDVVISEYTTFLDAYDYIKIEKIAQNNKLPHYLQENLMLSIAALKILGLEYDVADFNKAKLFGRLSRVDENIFVDVGHNTLAAQSIYEALKENKYILVYNSYKDKNYKNILRILQPIIYHVELIDIDDERIEEAEILMQVMKELEIKYKRFKTIQKHQNYLVFGSFSVVESFLKEYRG
ncbi:bifunctional folylpolyglutamate synthase/dihydrofolate synthase [Sulfurimonas sp.]